jgi:Tol biopolymer transport system component
MAIKSETRLGPYEIVSAIGAGGMGEVYRARDPRLKRDVAIKVLPTSFSSDPQRLHRFEQEAIAAGALNHPNILAVYDIGQQDGSPYIVSELLDGATLRERLRSGPLPIRKAVDYAQQIASGLAAAHDKGIVHRDLKPENIFVTNDGRVKILDFGLAKLTRSEGTESGDALTQTVQSDPGTVLGTVGYMSPEQVRGKPADARSDLFSFGAILYEMLSGKRAFHGESPAETMSAIVKEEPPELTETNRNVPPALERIVRHCLEKNSAERFHSAHDVAFDLEMLSSITSTGVAAIRAKPAMPARARQALLALVALAALGLVFFLGRNTGHYVSAPRYSALTFKRGLIRSARFSSDGHNVVYTAAWNGKTTELFNTSTQTRGTVPIGIKGADIQAVGPSGDMLILQDPHQLIGWANLGTLARVPVTGGTPRALMEDVQSADFTPDGNIVVLRYAGQRFRLECPPGKVLYETAGWMSHVRVSPKGDLIAFLDHPLDGDDRGSVAIVDRAGKEKKTLSTAFASAQGLAWSLSGDEIWFTASESGSYRALYAVSTTGHQRLVATTPNMLTIRDIAADGDVLLTTQSERRHMFALGPQMPHEIELEAMDWPLNRALTPDGKYVLYEEGGEGGGPEYEVYLAATDGSSNLRLGDGDAVAISPDGQWALTASTASPTPLFLVPIGVGERRKITNDQIDHRSASFLPGGKRIIFSGSEPGHKVRTYLQDLDGGNPLPITPEGTSGSLLSPDGNSVVVSDAARKKYVLSVADHQMFAIPGLEALDRAIQWSTDSQSIYVIRGDGLPAKVYKVDVRSGDTRLFKEFMPSDLAGASNFFINLTPDGRFYVYNIGQFLADLYVVKGLK